jgi:hypothetical protein
MEWKLGLIIYFVIGMILSIWWWEKEYKVEDEDELEKSTVCLFLLFLTFFWPVKLIKNLMMRG